MTTTPRTLVFSHANGFPSGTYRVLFDIWEKAGWKVLALPMLAHDPAFPVTSNWTHLREELLAFIEREADPAKNGPVMLAGHSLGGALSLLAACKKPEWAAGLVLLDSPVVTGWRAHSVRMAKATRLIGRIPPGKTSQSRRQKWADRTEVMAHFSSKHKFARWDPRVLADYVQSGFKDVDGVTRLAFTRDVETRIYNTLPHNFERILRNHPPRCPVAFVAGTQSEELRQASAGPSKRLARHHFHWMEGSHLYPFERPDDTAALVLQLLEALEAETASL